MIDAEVAIKIAAGLHGAGEVANDRIVAGLSAAIPELVGMLTENIFRDLGPGAGKVFAVRLSIVDESGKIRVEVIQFIAGVVVRFHRFVQCNSLSLDHLVQTQLVFLKRTRSAIAVGLHQHDGAAPHGPRGSKDQQKYCHTFGGKAPSQITLHGKTSNHQRRDSRRPLSRFHFVPQAPHDLQIPGV